MNKQIPTWLAILIILMSFFVLVTMAVKIGFDKGVEAEHQIMLSQVNAAYKAGYWKGFDAFQPRVVEVPVIRYASPVKIIETTVYRYPNTPPYEALPDPINLEQALALLYGMRASHEAALNWTFTSDPGFGIDDKDLQRRMMVWYDQLIDFVRRDKEQENEMP